MIDPSDLHARLEALYHRLRDFPEGARCEHGVHLKRDAYVAFLDLRKLIETEVLPYLGQASTAPARPAGDAGPSPR